MASFGAWLASLDEDELRVYRFELYDRLEIAREGSDVYRFARSALDGVYAAERVRDIRRSLRDACRVADPDADPNEFADAVIAFSRAAGQSGDQTDVAGLLADALTVAQPRSRRTG